MHYRAFKRAFKPSDVCMGAELSEWQPTPTHNAKLQ